MNRRLIIIISVSGVVILIAVLVAVLLFKQQLNDFTATNITNTNNSQSTTNTTVTTTTDTNLDATTTVEVTAVDRDDRQAITSVATSFTERFGSYSTDTNFENIERSRYLMTTTMSDQADRIIKAGQATDTFRSTDSQVTGVKITDFSDGATGATTEISVRQTERIGQGTTNYANATARVTLKKVSGRWLVDSFRWL